MPRVPIKTTPAWYPEEGRTYQPGSRQQFVLNLRRAIPNLVGATWEEVGWGRGMADHVLPTLLPPYRADEVAESHPSEIEITIRPNFTVERGPGQEAFRRIFLRRLYQWMRSQVLPDDGLDIDVDLDFVVGCGGTMDHAGQVSAYWPDKLGEPYLASAEAHAHRT